GTVPGLTAGATYWVVVIDPKTIQLVSSHDQAVNPGNYIQTFTPAIVSSNTITILNNGFSPHEAVTYHAPAPQTFYTGPVNVDASVSNKQATLSDHPGASNIYFVDGDAHPINTGFANGDVLVYHVASGDSQPATPIGGLIDGNEYRVASVNGSAI